MTSQNAQSETRFHCFGAQIQLRTTRKKTSGTRPITVLKLFSTAMHFLIDGCRVNQNCIFFFQDPCKTEGCNAPYNVGCRVVNNRAQCICPTCPNILKPVCASDDVQDLSECQLRQQACGMDIAVTVAKQAPCGTCLFFL